MISAPNRRLRLNGNKPFFLILIALIGILSCSAPRTVAKKPPVAQPPTEKGDKVRVYDPKTDTYILIPRDAIKVDTVQWTEDTTPPVITDKDPKKDKPSKKDHYDVALLMPFNVQQAPLLNEQHDSRLNRFLHYYAGIKMGFDEIGSMDLPITFHAFDIDASPTAMTELLKRRELKEADVLIGPYEREDIELAASFGLDNEIMVVSPWLPAFSGPTENPFLIQMYPGLSTHADAILKFIKTKMPNKKIYVVSRNTPSETNRIQLFNKNPDIQINELIIKDASPDLINTDLHSLLSDEAGSIFIMPYFAKSDENFVNSFMRKLHADKDTREAIVFGLPQWVGYTNLNPNYMQSLSLHLSISSFIDNEHPSYHSFREKFFKMFHTAPDLQAFLGYDLIRWIAENLHKRGQEGLIGNLYSSNYGLASGFDIKPIFKSETSPATEMKVPLYYENRMIRIIRYIDQDFTLLK